MRASCEKEDNRVSFGRLLSLPFFPFFPPAAPTGEGELRRSFMVSSTSYVVENQQAERQTDKQTDRDVTKVQEYNHCRGKGAVKNRVYSAAKRVGTKTTEDCFVLCHETHHLYHVAPLYAHLHPTFERHHSCSFWGFGVVFIGQCGTCSPKITKSNNVTRKP